MDSKVIETCKIPENVLNKTIVIIGAGIAGLSCAARLKQYGFNTVKIYEARNYIGGRIRTVHFDSNFIDLGAEWIHGEVENLVYQFALDKQLVKESAPDYYHLLTSLKTYENKKEYAVMIEFIEFLESKFTCIDHIENEKTSLSYLQYHLKSFLSKTHEIHKKLLMQVFEWYLKLQAEINGWDLSELSVTLLNNYKVCEGNPTVEVENGCTSIVDSLLKEIPHECIFNNHVVEEIDWMRLASRDIKYCSNVPVSKKSYECLNCSEKIQITFKGGKIITCDHVIITVPLGCLQKSKIIFFPELNKNKQLTIKSLGFGCVNKIFLEFENPFWKATDIFNVLWEEETFDKVFEECGNKNLENKICWPKSINRFAYVIGYPEMLCAWIAGEGAAYAEDLNDELIINGCMKLLELVLKRKLPQPSRVIRSSWMSDPYSCGSYSYLSIKSETKAISHKNLSEPICSDKISCLQHPVIQFAGEATHPHYYSTMHGAYETGLREAIRLNEHYSSTTLHNDKSSTSCHAVGNDCEGKNPKDHLKVIVIGGGISGLTCGLSLQKAGFQKLEILEAQNIVGGRIASLNYHDYALELGASWLHGCNNALYGFSSDHDLLSCVSDDPSHEGEGIFYTSNGDVIDSHIVDETKDALRNIKAELDFHKADYLKSVMEFFTSSFKTYLSKFDYSHDTEIKIGLFNWFLKYETIDNSCDSLDDVAIQSYSDWEDCSEEVYHLSYKHGYNSLIDILHSQISNDLIKLKQPVKCINWNDNFILSDKHLIENRADEEFPVVVQCEDGSSIPADSVIITSSIGFLKENINTFFNPKLPENKVQAISKHGFGTINKIYLLFEKPFWDSKCHGFQFIWLDTVDDNCQLLLQKNPWICGITGFDVVRKQPNVLLGWIGGLEAKMIEEVDDQTVSNVCTELFRIFLKEKTLPNPKKIFRSYWYRNPYIRGAYCYRSVSFHESGCSLEDFSPLYCPFRNQNGDEFQWPIVIFSGEATDENAFSSTHGAFQSGIKAAKGLSEACFEIQLNSKLRRIKKIEE